MALAATAARGLLKSQVQSTTINARLALAWASRNLRHNIAVVRRATQVTCSGCGFHLRHAWLNLWSGYPSHLKSYSIKVHRIIDCFGLEGTLKIIQCQPPCHGQRHLPLDWGAQSPIQPGLEDCQGGGSHNSSGQPVPLPHHPHSKEFLPYI